MGGGVWTTSSFRDYSASVGRTVDKAGGLSMDINTQQTLFKRTTLSSELNPYNKIRECRDSDEHPNTLPVILALDVTGSMGRSAKEIASKLNIIMEKIFDNTKDVEFMVQAIGDEDYDDVPFQMSQFESDIRIAKQLDKVYFEGGGGGNNWESYSYAWYAAWKHCDLDVWKRGGKGIIITIGDEPLNPYIKSTYVEQVFGDNLQESKLATKDIYNAIKDKYDIYHISVSYSENEYNDEDFRKLLGNQNVYRIDRYNLSKLSNIIVDIVNNHSNNESSSSYEPTIENNGMISW